MSLKSPLILVICDGFGYSTRSSYNAIFHATTPTFTQLWNRYPHTTLTASGNAVGLLEGNIGNSEVGHLTIGCGRITPQSVTITTQAIDDGTFFTNKALNHGLDAIKEKNGSLHIMGMLSDAGIHSHDALLYAACDLAIQKKINAIYIHAFLDGRDKAPESASQYLKKLDAYVKAHQKIHLASISGRFFAMDRDNHWDRIEQCYHVLTIPQKRQFSTWQEVLDYYYAQGTSDEFIPPTQLDPAGIIKPHDGIFFFNLRPDRARQLAQSLTDPDFSKFDTKNIPLACFITPVSFGKQINSSVMFPEQAVKNCLVDILLAHKKTVCAVAETEKRAHVTYFFNGGREEALHGETQLIIPSLKLETYESKPCMSAPAITHAVLNSLKTAPADFYVVNYANADMIGHSGNYDATIKAVECLDAQLAQLYSYTAQHSIPMIITADHGNAEEMFDFKAQQPKTSHTANPVPFIFVDPTKKDADISHMKTIADIAPFILHVLGIPIPTEMNSCK